MKKILNPESRIDLNGSPENLLKQISRLLEESNYINTLGNLGKSIVPFYMKFYVQRMDILVWRQ